MMLNYTQFCGNPSADNAIKRDLVLRVVCCPSCYRSECVLDLEFVWIKLTPMCRLATLEELEAFFPSETFGDDTIAEVMATLPTSSGYPRSVLRDTHNLNLVFCRAHIQKVRRRTHR